LLPEAFDVVDDRLPLTVQCLKRLYIERKSPIRQTPAGCIQVVAEIIEVEHL
jgi:hypothetical protein